MIFRSQNRKIASQNFNFSHAEIIANLFSDDNSYPVVDTLTLQVLLFSQFKSIGLLEKDLCSQVG